MTKDEEQVMRAVINERGYLVVCSSPSTKIGTIFNSFMSCEWGHSKSEQQFCIISKTTREDMNAQIALVEQIMGRKIAHAYNFRWDTFFRVNTD